MKLALPFCTIYITRGNVSLLSHSDAFLRGREFERKHGDQIMPWRLKGYWLGYKAGRMVGRMFDKVKADYLRDEQARANRRNFL